MSSAKIDFLENISEVEENDSELNSQLADSNNNEEEEVQNNIELTENFCFFLT